MLERERNAAAAALQFERAAVLRDRLEALAWLAKHLERLRQAVQDSFIYPVTGDDGSVTWYLIRRGLVQAALSAPRDATERQAAKKKLEEIYPARPPLTGALGLDEVDGVLLVAGWFRRHRDERSKLIAVERELAGECADTPVSADSSLILTENR
jgi:excinuclease ABC subunit C